jgi:arabinoxylan arabinofuranohydrolase
MRFPCLGLAVGAALTLVTLPLAADYPIVSHRSLADPATLVHDGRVYVYCSNDDDNAVEGGYAMKSLVCVSSSDLKNWTDHGEVLRVPTQAAWATHAWAPAAIARNGQFYLYFANNASSIGVTSGPSPIGPFTDPRGSPLINSSTPGVLPATNIWIFDPSVFIDDDGQAYCYFGGNGESNVRIIRLNPDMISTSGSAMPMTVQNFFEAAWVHKRNGLYYFSYSTTTAAGLRIDYLTSTNPTSGFTYRGIVAGQPPSNNNNNHAAQFELRGQWYHVYHNRVVAIQAGIPPVYRRNIAIEALAYNDDGTIRQVTYTTDGVAQAQALDPYARVEAETTNAQSGIETEPCSEGGMQVSAIHPGDWIRVRGVDFGSRGAMTFQARAASAGGGGSIELRLDSPTGTLAGTCAIGATGGAQTWATTSCPVSGASGLHDLYLVFTGVGSNLFAFTWWQFIEHPAPPQITVQPRSLTLAPGRRISLWVEATGTEPLQYRWLKDGVAVPGAQGRFLEVAAASASDAGAYVVEVTNAAATVASSAATVTLDAAANARLVNMSVRAPLAPGAIIIPGFVLSGGTPQELLIRAVGPTLARFDVANVHADPTMTLYSGSTPVLANDNWGAADNAAAIASTSRTLGAFSLNAGSLDAAMLLDLEPASFTTHVSGVGGASGIVLFELYSGAIANSRLVNISARGDIGTGENVMIPGFTIAGTGATTLLVRAVGPSLERFQVAGRLGDPTLTIFQGQTPIFRNDDWGQAPDVAALLAAQTTVRAFALNSGSADAAALVPLMPGTYTVQASGAAGSTGNVLVEVYEVP